jgi:hypothetical protein
VGSLYFAGTAHAANDVEFVCAPPSDDGELTPPPSAPPDDGIPPANDRTPSPECTPNSGEVVWGTRGVQFTVDPDPGQRIRSVALYVLADEPKVPHANSGDPIFYEEFQDAGSAPNETKTYRLSWDSVRFNPYNGRYKLRVVSSSWAPNFPNGYVPEDSPPVERRNIRVDNEPRSLKPVTVLATTSSSVSVKWGKAAEPDVLSYTLYRAISKDSGTKPKYSDLRPVATTKTTSFRDDDVKPGAYWYSVKATRRSIVTPETGITSTFSPLSSAATVEPTPAPQAPGSGSAAAARARSLRRFVPLSRLTAPSVSSRSAPVPDAPYSAYLPYDKPDADPFANVEGSTEERGADPRGVVLPVAVGAFLVSSAMALGRMPY